MTVRVCVSVRETTTQGAKAAIDRAARWADLVEVRADYIRDLDLRKLLQKKSRPLLFTLRSRREGGEFQGPERKRIETILEAAQCGADYVDIEFAAFWRIVLATCPPSRVVLSHHDLHATPASLDSLLADMAATGAGILKIATRACTLADNLRIANLLRHASSRGINLAALAMGRPGIVSRIFGPLWGSWMTIASMPGGEPTAEGQIPADTMTDQYRIRRIGPHTELFGVLGDPLGHSLSPAVHNAAFAARGRDAVMVPMEAAGMDDFLEFNAVFPVQGACVTSPYKQHAFTLSRSLSVPAEQTGASNTLARRESGWHGDNTDVEGFIRPLKRRVHPGRLRAMVLGAGGAARAVVYSLTSSGASVCVAARDAAKAQALAEKFGAGYVEWRDLENQHWDLLVNATPVGMHPDVGQSPVPAELHKGEWVYDLVYNPVETRLLREAAQRGCRTISGIEMFLTQAAKQQQLWCGAPVPEEAMEQALRTARAASGTDTGSVQ